MSRKQAPTNRHPGSTKAAPAESADTKRAPALSNLRGQIDKLDLDLVSLLNRRAEIASQIGQIKHTEGWTSGRRPARTR